MNAKQHHLLENATKSKILLNGNAGCFSLMNWQPQRPHRDSIVVLPNGYGLLEYANSVCEEFASRGHPVYAVNVRGQGGNAGEWSILGAAEEISAALEFINAERKPLRCSRIVAPRCP